MADAIPGVPASHGPERLESWKEIAVYLRRDVKTVQRWEKRERLPVHRHAHDRQGSVYAFRAEVDAWREGRRGCHRLRKRSVWKAVTPLATAVILAAALVAVYRAPLPPSQAGPSRFDTVAVLPVRNLSGRTDEQFLADGVTEALTVAFSRLGPFSAISSGSTRRFRDVSASPREISKALGGVDGLVEGVVTRQGERLELTVALVDPRSERRLWTKSYERSISDAPALYNEVAIDAARGLGLVLTEVQQSRGLKAPRTSAAAYDAYLRGVHASNSWMAGGCLEAERYFLEAIDRDARFAPAWARLARCYVSPARMRRWIEELAPKTQYAARRALELDPTLGLPHTVLAAAAWRHHYDPASAEWHFRKAIELEPNSDLTLVDYGEFLLYYAGRVQDGLDMIARAVRLNPLSPDRNVALAFNLSMAGRQPDAIEQFGRALELDPSNATALELLADAYAFAGDRDASMREHLRWLERVLGPESFPTARAAVDAARRRDGWAGFWRAATSLDARITSREPGTGAYLAATRHARTGEHEEALGALESAYAQRSHMIVIAPMDPTFAELRDDSRFQDLVRRVRGESVRSQGAAGAKQ
jgi:TolB-like protein